MIEQIFSSENPRVPLFRLAFRSFFLFGALFGATAIAVWVVILNSGTTLSLYGGPIFWHTHEMLFGFVAAIIVGFLLTAVQNWTGVKTINGLPLFCLFACWLIPRIGFLYQGLFQSMFLAALDISFLLLAAFFLSLPLLRAKQTRNLFFVPVLLLFSYNNGLMHYGLAHHNQPLIMQATHSSLLLVAVLMVVIGGRVIPMFTANGTQTQRVENIAWLDKAALSSVWLVMILFLIGGSKSLPTALMGSLFVIAAALNLVRLLRWRFWITFKVALLWPLHLAYGFIAVAFLLLGYDLISSGHTSSVAWHTLTVGGIGVLILSMIARVSLGHTGRALQAPTWMVPAFIMMALCTVARTLLPSIFVQKYLFWITVSGCFWVAAYGIFVLGYFSILTKPRIDQRPG